MSGLKIGLVTSVDEESAQLVSLLESQAAQIVYNISPAEIQDEHIGDQSIHVWLLNVDDDSWHDAVDHLLDESEIPVYFSEPGTLTKQSHPEYWCANLIERLYEITGLEKSEVESEPELESEPEALSQAGPEIEGESGEEVSGMQASDEVASANELNSLTLAEGASLDIEEMERSLDESLNELEITSVGLPKDIAAELVSELEDISPVLSEDVMGLEQVETTQDIQQKADADAETEHEPLVEEVVIEQELQQEELVGENESSDSLDEFELQLDQLAEESSENDDEELELEFDQFDNNLESAIAEKSKQTQEQNRQALNDDLQGSLDLELDDDDLDMSLEPDWESSVSFEEEELEDEPEQRPAADTGIENSESESISTEHLSLEPLAEETHSPGKANFLSDDNSLEEDVENDSAPQPEEKLSEQAHVETSTVSMPETNLSLEPMEGELKSSGKANFLDDSFGDDNFDDSSLDESSLDESSLDESSLDESSLGENDFDTLKDDASRDVNTAVPSPASDLSSLELEEDRVNLDEVPDDLELLQTESETELSPEAVSNFAKQAVESVSSKQKAEDEHPPHAFEQSLDDAESYCEPELLTSDDSSEDALALDSFELDGVVVEAEEENTSDNLLEEEQCFSPVDGTVLSEESQQSEEVFEIPMLDETASGIEFEVEKTPIVVHEKIPCWVIGASLGGPAAVKRFMQSLPSDIKASFIIAQHIDENFLPVLAEILTNSSDFEVTVANGSNEMSRGKFYIAPLKGKTVFLKDGSMLVDHSQKWSGPYSPCIDDVIESVSHAYGESAGAIIFSGMGQDGVNGARRLREKGGQVWAQSLDTCANPTMPSAIIDSGEVDFIGTPEDLAQNLVTYLSAHA
ncbi:chemotaxis protein CheB [Aliikangiella sp. G2MR2-5]|uniref:chemotaxis protein CheB n=1 Tax=Aliikangiella sp. G2MR2-5 TaxID=2788943 RepID=UPI0018A9DADF